MEEPVQIGEADEAFPAQTPGSAPRVVEPDQFAFEVDAVGKDGVTSSDLTGGGDDPVDRDKLAFIPVDAQHHRSVPRQRAQDIIQSERPFVRINLVRVESLGGLDPGEDGGALVGFALPRVALLGVLVDGAGGDGGETWDFCRTCYQFVAPGEPYAGSFCFLI